MENYFSSDNFALLSEWRVSSPSLVDSTTPSLSIAVFCTESTCLLTLFGSRPEPFPCDWQDVVFRAMSSLRDDSS